MSLLFTRGSHEKGRVEGLAEYARRTYMVPVSDKNNT